MTVPLVDLRAQTNALKEEIRENVLAVLESTQYINGPSVSSFEEQLAAYTGTSHGVGCASGTDALYLALRACGIGLGDEVITTPFTFVATAEAICRCGARPVFVDIDPVTYNLDPTTVARAVTSKTRAILPVHLFGHAADMDSLLEIARANGLKLIEDCAQALGGTYNGRTLGGISDVGCFSFYPSKTLGAAGDGGAIVTNDSGIAEQARRLREHGASDSYHHEEHGINSRLDTIQAAVLCVKLRDLDMAIEQRNQVAAWYDNALEGLLVKRPVVMDGCGHAFGYYTIEVDNRATVQTALDARRIGNAVYYPMSLHLQPVFAYLGYSLGDFPNSERAQSHVISLPIYPGLTFAQVEETVSALKGTIAKKVM